ncbi:hypothetical protein AMAG_05296 [Allomyces macrogynus ATCC 38327]|uniref:Uncharacterized protein n=1 Tax=Allomyces macrogynus (strain ATCC 38327) TaxID=578462 RepID=A0A0L0SBA3_ALLM3|nr:hypothetical protein AMAG_05296 [Allomyces macrogynus ATCC 38327]|eukprot:KNE59843.1 hypothetical protein AMAG_05296 [Allomyces macrogynus ATCC 38327]
MFGPWIIALIVVTAVLSLALIISVSAALPGAMAGGFMGSTVVHIPALKRAYIFGGRSRRAESESSKNFDNSNAVANAGFVLPAVSYFSPAVATVSGAGESATYSVTLFGNRQSVWRIPDLTAAKPMVETLRAPPPVGINFPAYPLAVTVAPSSPTTTYIYGHERVLRSFDRRGNLANVSMTGTYSIDWTGMVTAWDDNTVVLTGGYSLRDAQLSWIYTYDLIASKWAQYSFNVTGGRNDHASVVYSAFSKKFLITVGGTDVPTTSVVEYLDLAARAPPVRASVQNSTAGPAQIGGHAMFLQGNYLVCVGGWDMGGTSHLLNLLEFLPQGDGTLRFAWADTYKTPAATGSSTSTTASKATKTPTAMDSDETATGSGGGGLSTDAIAGIAAARLLQLWRSA